MDKDIKPIVRIHKVYGTVLTMLSDRGYTIASELLSLPLEDFCLRFNFNLKDDEEPERREELTIHALHSTLRQGICVFFPLESKINVKVVKNCQERTSSLGAEKCIIVYKDATTPSAKEALNECKIEAFSEQELMVNITSHQLVPRHVVLTQEETEQVLTKYSLRPTQLPRILVSDPVARYYGVKKGDVVKIIRSSETAGRYVTYRYVN
eukprot:TRINITY_DN353_c0_g2_i3.p1 TRINITY_DN353_c0_g2~~TRINITY_DN353_c0_g2_i3.p1  ORF type:complete len:209 (-),score=68.74 TRINITY_DN353_c0_g2_i3:119-745(-)